MSNLFDAYFSFNSTGSVSSKDSFSAFLDDDGNIINYEEREYGVYNKTISINYHRLFYIKKYSIGLGDVIDYITEKTKIKDLIIYLTKGNCGCEERRILFNKWIKIPWYWFKFRELYVEDYDVISTIKYAKKNNVKLSKFKKNILHRKEPTMNNKENTQRDTVKPKPVEVEKIKGCGCKNKNK